jgi:hypothetical protein
MDWQPIATAPFDRDLELATIDATGSYALAFACRRLLRGWVNARTRTTVNIYPTHWREWGRTIERPPSREQQERATTIPFRSGRLSDEPKDLAAKNIAKARAVVAKAKYVLNSSTTNSFAGRRKTQEPPADKDEQ